MNEHNLLIIYKNPERLTTVVNIFKLLKEKEKTKAYHPKIAYLLKIFLRNKYETRHYFINEN